jgi:cyclophilin family peptidyl-prolyl cis-trans isomerase
VGRAQKLKQQRKEERALKEKEAKKDVLRKVAMAVAAVLVVGATVGLIFLVNALKKEEAEKPKVVSTRQMVLDTSKGEIVVDLFNEDAPLTVDHITSLAEQGFYDNLRWYRVEDWLVQTGSHTQSLLAESEGGEPDQALLQEAYQKDMEVGTVLDEIGQPNVRGAIAMAKQGSQQGDQQAQATSQYVPNSARTDFFILKTDAPWLDQDFTVFGRVVKGMDVVDTLEATDVLNSVQVRDKK